MSAYKAQFEPSCRGGCDFEMLYRYGMCGDGAVADRCACRGDNLGLPDDLGNLDCDPCPCHDDLSACDRVVVGKNLDHIGLGRFEFYDRPTTHPQQHMDRHPIATQHHGKIDLEIVQRRQSLLHASEQTFSEHGEPLVNDRASLGDLLLPVSGSPPVEWVITDEPVAYERAVAAMEERVDLIRAGRAAERVWLLEHPALYTAGTSARDEDLVDPDRFPVHRTGRGGQFTYHGPGQRVAYVMLDLQRRTPDLRRYVAALESWIIGTLAEFNIRGERREDRVGVWVRRPDRGDADEKIAAIGIRVRRWVTFHGISLNVEPDLSHFSGIVPCGVRTHGVTSLIDLGIPVTMAETDSVLRREFERVFGPTVSAALQ